MTNKDQRPKKPAPAVRAPGSTGVEQPGPDLRRRAEKKIKADETWAPEIPSIGDPARIVHELRVHQLELEMQNEELRRAQAELDAARACYFDLYDLAPVGYLIHDEKGLIQEANLTVAGLLGVKRGDLVKKPLTRFIFPEDQDIYDRHRKMLFETGVPQIYELRMTGKDGSFFWARVEAAAARAADGASPVCRAVISDITERKRMLESLQKSEARLRAILDATPFPIALVDVHDDIIDFWSRSALSLFGHTAPTAAEWYQIAYPDPDYRREVMERWKPSLEKARISGQAVNTGEYRVTCRDGSVRICEFYAAFLEDKLVVTFNDITERRKSEEALTASEKRFKDIADNAQEWIWEVDATGKYTYASPTVERILGYLPEEMLQKPFYDFFHPEDRATFQAAALAFFSSKQPFREFINRNVHKNGQVIWLATSGLPLLDDKGNLLGYRGADTDITERKRAESQREVALEEVARKAKELQEKNDELTRFIHAVSHDLRSPLVTVKTFLGHLEDDLRHRNQERVEEDLGFIKIAAGKMGRLLDELLRLSRVGRMINPAVDVSLQTVVKEALDVTAGRIAQRGVRIEVTNEPVGLYGDRARLVEIFQNLVDNAAKFMGGQPEPRIEIGVESVDRETVLFVRDNGIGLDPNLSPRLFGLFEKFDAATDGVGLGLALVRRIVELHGGRIWAESEGPGRGATFRFTLAKTRRDSGRKDQA